MSVLNFIARIDWRRRSKFGVDMYESSFFFFLGLSYGFVQIGVQQFKVMFDTGGFSRWIPSSRSAADHFPNRVKYDENSPTRTSLEKQYVVSYSGEQYEGNVVMDNILIAGQSVEQFTFVEMICSSITVDASVGHDGIFGMSKPSKGRRRWEIFEVNLLDHFLAVGTVQEAVFTFRFCGQPGMRRFSWFVNGDLIFGGVRDEFHHLPIVYLPTYQSKQWMVYIDSIVYGDVILCMSCYALLDTGTPGTRAPGKALQMLLQDSVVEVYDAAVLHVPHQRLPYLLPITINLRSHAFTLHPEQLVRPVGNVYVFAIDGTQDASENNWLIGISFLRHFHTIFDQQNNRVGFAAVKC
ncbi:eukaryotic aspartyl protease [Opisthorchis viverrini]|uniref:Eukaryotic aspartyl protease n=2 Tax=Opisthorchis viverrini TaxID=6198 RepID=A0A1S8WW76_OPIVI|nr:eukaryotic aspartyl protease [Opisthorchis viverrini]